MDTDGDGVEDGYEYQSAIDLNNDDYQTPNVSLPYPGKTPYPNPLFKDGDVDYDGDGLRLSTEYQLWKYTYQVNHTAARTLSPLSYSDGTQYSLSTVAYGRRIADDGDRRLHPAGHVPQLGRRHRLRDDHAPRHLDVGPVRHGSQRRRHVGPDAHRRRPPSSSTGTCDADG